MRFGSLFVPKFLLTIMFIISGIYKFFDNSIGVKKLTKCAPSVFKENYITSIIVICGAIWELISAFAVYSKNKKTATSGCYSLILFTIVATIICHFPPTGYVYYPFISNITTIGGLYTLSKLINSSD